MGNVDLQSCPGRCLTCVLLLVWCCSAAHGQQAIRFSGDGSYLEAPHDSTLFSRTFTIEFWLKVRGLGPADVAGGEQTVFDNRFANSGVNIRLAGTTFPISLFAIHGPDAATAALDRFDAFRWVHVATTQGPDSLRLYLDGRLHQATAGAYIDSTDNPLHIGDLAWAPNGSLPLRGDLDEFRIWNYERPADSIAARFSTSLSGDEEGLTLYFDFEEVDGDTLRDRSSHGNDAAIFGSPAFVPSSAPVGFEPLTVPTGLRAYGEETAIALAWPAGGERVAGYALFRGDSLLFLPDESHLLSVAAYSDTSFVDDRVEPGQTYFYRLRTMDAEGRMSEPGRVAASRLAPLGDPHLVGAFYLPSVGPEDGGAAWENDFVRGRLSPPQEPLLGLYSNRDPEVVRQHVAWMEEYGIDFIVEGGWTRFAWSSQVLANEVLEALENTPVKFAWLVRLARYGRDGTFIDAADADSMLVDFNWLADTFFSHPNYLTIDGRHVVFINATTKLGGDFESGFNRVREAMRDRGFELQLLFDDAGWSAPYDTHFGVLDGVYQYAPIGTEQHRGYAVDTDYLADLSVRAARWGALAERSGKAFVPTVVPGFNQRTLTPPPSAIPRQTYPGGPSTSMLEESIRVMRPFVDPQLRMLVVHTFNRWQQDTQIEPAAPAPPTDQDESGVQLYTEGYVYEGDGFRPLEVVRDLLAPEVVVGMAEQGSPSSDGDVAVYPNPTQTGLTIRFTTATAGSCKAEMYDVLGRRVAVVFEDIRQAGTHRVFWSAAHLAPGLYIVRLRASTQVHTFPVVKIAA